MRTLLKNMFILVLILLNACKKYPEGGLHAFANRNLEGGWKLEKYEVNGIDSTNLIITNNNNTVKDNFLEIGFSKPSYNFAIYPGEILYRFRIDLSNKKTLIGGRVTGGITSTPVDSSHINIGGGMFSRNIFAPEADRTEWKILTLNSKKIVLEYQASSRYLISMRKK